VIRHIGQVMAKDLRIELRTRAAISTMMLFALLVLFVFSFALPPGHSQQAAFAPSVLWVTILFASVIGMSRVFGVETEQGCLSALMVTPIDPAAIFLGKFGALLVQLLLLEAVAVPVFFLFYGYGWGPGVPLLILLLLLGTIGIAAVGTLFSAMTASLQGREFILPLLLLPLSMPLLLAAVRATGVLLAGDLRVPVWPWFAVVGCFDVTFLAASTMLFEFVLGED